ncbi:MAG TPA: lanthionine synthetase C family protein [Kofleriaceae bacterium]|nr:lanthionine synthetase C family protein [Kofleriaceae bacterium]
MIWRPLLVGARADRVGRTIARIAERLAGAAGGPEVDLAHGAAGVAVFFDYLAEAGLGAGSYAEAMLDRAFQGVADHPMLPGLHEGFTGIAWAAQHVLGDADEVVGDIDAAVLELTGRSPWVGRYDLVSGLVGLGVYALERRPHGAADAILDNVVARLDELAEDGATGRCLRTPPDAIHFALRSVVGGDCCTTGVAHGVAAAIGLLGSVPGDRARRLRHALTAWLASVADPRPDGSTYPPFVSGEGLGLGRRGPAWCSGDLGIAAALSRAGRATGEHGLEELAVAAAHRATSWSMPHDVSEPTLCHGTAGVLHVFNRLYHTTGQTVFGDAAVRWLDDTLALCERDDGVLVSRLAHEQPGLLTGAAGIGLALLAAITDREPRWDIVLLT